MTITILLCMLITLVVYPEIAVRLNYEFYKAWKSVSVWWKTRK